MDNYTPSYQKKDEEAMKRLGFTIDNIPYPPQVRGVYSEGGKQFVSVVEHNGASGWVEVGHNLVNSGWKVEAYDEGKNQVRMSAFGIPAKVDIGYGVPTGDVDRPYKIVKPENYQAEFQNFTEAKHNLFQDNFKSLYETVLKPSALGNEKLNDWKNANKGIFGNYNTGGAMTETDKSMKDIVTTGDDQDLETDNNNPSYQYSPEIMNKIRSNYEESGGDASNVVSLQEFRQMQKDGTAKEGVDYLIPSTKDGETDFGVWKHFNQKSE